MFSPAVGDLRLNVAVLCIPPLPGEAWSCYLKGVLWVRGFAMGSLQAKWLFFQNYLMQASPRGAADGSCSSQGHNHSN